MKTIVLFISTLFLFSCKRDQVFERPLPAISKEKYSKGDGNDTIGNKPYILFTTRASKSGVESEQSYNLIENMPECNANSNLCFEGFDVSRIPDGNCTGNYQVTLYISVKSEIAPIHNYSDIYKVDDAGVVDITSRASLYFIDNSGPTPLYKYRYEINFSEINLTPCTFLSIPLKIHFNYTVQNFGNTESAYYADGIFVIPTNITGVTYYFFGIAPPNSSSIMLTTDPGICISQNCYFQYGPGTFFYEYRPITTPQSPWTTVSVTPFFNTVTLNSLSPGTYQVRGRLQNLTAGPFQFQYSPYYYYPFPINVN